MKKISDVKEIQSYILPVMKYIDEVCEKHNLRYSLARGSMLGAIRHKGFIPWDDDMDIIMPRPDFDKLIEIFNKNKNERFKILSPYDYDSFYVGQMMKIYDSSTKLHEFSDKYNLVYGAYVDVFPIDGIPTDINKAKKHHKKYNKYRKILHVLSAYRFRKKNDIKKKLSNLLKPLLYKYVDECKKYHHKYDYNNSKRVSLLVQTLDFERDILDKSWFDSLIKVKFEDTEFRVFEKYDEALTRYYGNYMQLPPKEEQEPHHSFDLYVKK